MVRFKLLQPGLFLEQDFYLFCLNRLQGEFNTKYFEDNF